jgi:hypothetical protein
MKCTWHRPAKRLWQLTISSSPVTKPNFQRPANAWRKIKKSSLPSMTFQREHWSHLRTTNPIESTFATVRLRTHRTKGSGSRIATLTMVFKLGLEARKALAPAPGFPTDPKGSYWCSIRRWRGTNPTGRLTSHFNKDAPSPDTQVLTISHW